MADRLSSDARLNVGESITSNNGQYTLILQLDGNLVLYKAGGKALWATGTNGKAASFATQQKDGNFVLYGSSGALWALGTHGHQGTTLVVQDDGNLVIYGQNGALWATGTVQAKPLTAERSDNIEGGTMQTKVTLSSSGQITGITRTFTKVNFKGFTGAVRVVLFTDDGRSHVSQEHSYGVDGDMTGGRSDRTDTWTEQVLAEFASRVRECAILQYHNPKFELGKAFNELKSELGPIIVSLIAG
jgi:hypothetical protein